MRGKLLFITGGLVGYVLGARAGRQRYEQIAASAKDLWNAKPVQRRVTEVRDFALEAVGDVPSVLFEAGKKVFTQVQDKAQDKSAKSARSAKSAKSARTAGAQPAPSESASAARTAAAVKVAEAGATADAKAGPTTGAKSRPAKPAAKPATKPSEPTAN